MTAIQVRRKGLAVKRMERVRCFTSYQSVTVTTLASQGPRPYEPRRKWSSFFPLSVRKLGTSSPWARDDCNDEDCVRARMRSTGRRAGWGAHVTPFQLPPPPEHHSGRRRRDPNPAPSWFSEQKDCKDTTPLLTTPESELTTAQNPSATTKKVILYS